MYGCDFLFLKENGLVILVKDEVLLIYCKNFMLKKMVFFLSLFKCIDI